MSNPYNNAPGNPDGYPGTPGPSDGNIPSYGNYSAPNGQYGDPNQLLPGNDLPGAGRRLGGYIIDTIIIGIIAGAIASIAGVDYTAGTGQLFVFSLISVVLWMVLRTGSEALWGGTPGKRLLGMKVVGPNGGNPDALTALKRNLWYLVGDCYMVR